MEDDGSMDVGETMARDGPEAVTPLLKLPYELVIKVVRIGQLTHDDLRSLRLTCRHFAYGPTIACLFHTIGVSRFQRDIDNFIAIASHPRLAKQVRVVVWHEILSTREVVDWVNSDDVTTSWYPGFERHIHRTLKTQIRNISWDRVYSYWYNPQTEYLDEAPEVPLTRLFQAASSMPGIHTLISKPMHKDRRLTSRQDTSSYPITAQVLDGDYLVPRGPPSTWFANFGFYAFLLPLIGKRPSTHPITRLCFSDEDFEGCSDIQYDLHRDAFRHLTSLDFCLASKVSYDLLQLGECIRAAPNLRSLHICFENGGPAWYTSDGPDDWVDAILTGRCQPRGDFYPGVEPKDPNFKWANLQELRLSQCSLQARALGDFMRRQAHSLKKVQIYDCQFTVQDLRTISRMTTSPEKLQLEEFAILLSEAGDVSPGFPDPTPPPSSHDEDPLSLPHFIDEKQLVDFLNGSFACLPTAGTSWSNLATSLERTKSSQLVYTHGTVFDPITSYTGLVCDTRARCMVVNELYDPAEVKVLDMENGDIRDYNGYSFQAGTHFHPREHADERYLKLSRDNIDGFEEYDEEEDAEFEAFDYTVGDVSSSDDFDDGLRWVVARDRKGDVYCWQEKEDGDEDIDPPDASSGFAQYTSLKYKTEVWGFTHHSGETAIGRDPLEYWEDWEGEEAGDLAEALPVGYTMLAFLKYTMKPGRRNPKYQCSTKYIRARGGVKYRFPWSKYSFETQENIFADFLNRHNWVKSTRGGWKWKYA